MKVLSLFDGISCGRQALKELGWKDIIYYSSEIDEYAISVSRFHYPDIIRLSKVEDININEHFDLIIGGSPCQSFSNAGNKEGFKGKSGLFYEYVRILREAQKHNPKILFMLENVKMKKEWQDIISKELGVKPVEINSSLVSAQTRRRLYWTNIKGIEQPKDKKILLEKIIDHGNVDRDKSYCLDANYFKGTNVKQYICKSRRQLVWIIPEATKKGYVEVRENQFVDLTFIKSKTRRGRLMLNKSNCLTATMGTYCKVTKDWFRILTPKECERLQTLTDDYTKFGINKKNKKIKISNSQRYKMIGNGWTVEVIEHILKNIK